MANDKTTVLQIIEVEPNKVLLMTRRKNQQAQIVERWGASTTIHSIPIAQGKRRADIIKKFLLENFEVFFPGKITVNQKKQEAA